MHDRATSQIEIRPAHHGDERALVRLAQLDSAHVPPGPHLLAFENGELRAAMSIETGASIADPFAPTVRLLEILLMQTAWARRPRRSRLRPRPRLAPTAT